MSFYVTSVNYRYVAPHVHKQLCYDMCTHLSGELTFSDTMSDMSMILLLLILSIHFTSDKIKYSKHNATKFSLIEQTGRLAQLVRASC